MDVKGLFEKFRNYRVLVVGDVMVDKYLLGNVERVSPEAPVPIVNLSKSEERLGGAANVALNLLSLGADPVLCGVIGEDRGGDLFIELLNRRGMFADGMVRSKSRRTTIKTRVIGNNQQLLRIDEEEPADIRKEEEIALIQRVETQLKQGADAMILEDYNKGVLTERVIRELVALSKEYKIPVSVDPKKENFLVYREVTLFKPNLKELKEGIGSSFDFVDGKDRFEAAVEALESKLNNRMTLVTLSEHGVFIKEGPNKHYIPAHVRNIADVSGAGDTVIAIATLCLTAGLSPAMIADISNLSGGLVCELSGVVPISRDRLIKEVQKLVLA